MSTARSAASRSDFEALFRDHYAEIVRYLAARLGSRDDASELASEVFVEAWRRVPGLQWRGRPVRAWLYRVAANMAADEMKRRARHGPLPGDLAADDDAESVPDRIALGRALQTLPPDHQLVVHLRLVEGLPFAEVATIMNRSVGACQMTLLRAGKSLRAPLPRKGYASMREQTLALELERALRGEDAAVEARELAELLVAAVEPARFDVSDDEVERALAAAHPRPVVRRRGVPLLVAAAAAVVAGAAFLVLRTPGDDVQARALAAVQPTFFVVEETRPAQPGLFPASQVSGFVDGARGRAHMPDFVRGGDRCRGRSPARTGASRAGSPRATRLGSQPPATGYQEGARRRSIC